MIDKIISGGQTGVDRAALDAAIDLSLPYGGYCPKGRVDELGLIPQKYEQLIAISGDFNSEKENCDARGKRNIQESDGTLIIVPNIPLPTQIRDGTLFTIDEVAIQTKPSLLLSLSSSNDDNISNCIEWMKKNNIHILNIAGPRESSWNGIYKLSYDFLSVLFSMLI